MYHRGIQRGAGRTRSRRRTPNEVIIPIGGKIVTLDHDMPPYAADTRFMLGFHDVPKPGDTVMVQNMAGDYFFEDFDPEATEGVVAVVLAAVAPAERCGGKL